MDRGLSGSIRRLEAVEFKIQKKEEEYAEVLEKFEHLKIEFNKASDLVIKKNILPGLKKIETEKTIQKFEETYKALKSENIKKDNHINAQTKQLSEAQKIIEEVKLECAKLEKKIKYLYSNPQYYSDQCENYFRSIEFILEQKIDFQIALQPHRKRDNLEEVKDELFEIASKISTQNGIPQESLMLLFKNKDYFKKLADQLLQGKKKTNFSSQDRQQASDVSNKR